MGSALDHSMQCLSDVCNVYDVCSQMIPIFSALRTPLSKCDNEEYGEEVDQSGDRKLQILLAMKSTINRPKREITGALRLLFLSVFASKDAFET